MMAALDFTLNSVTMLALVLMVGIVIDDAIVVLENIFRFVEEKKMGPFEAAAAATAEIALPVLATTLSLAVIFIPVSFMSSISGRFLYQFGITAAVAIMVSLLVSFTLTPMMSARLLHVDPEGARRHAAGTADTVTAGRRRAPGSTARSTRPTPAMLAWSMRHRLVIAGVALAFAVVVGAALQDGAAGIHSERRRRSGVRSRHHRAGRHERVGDERRRDGARKGDPQPAEGDDWCSSTVGGSFLSAVNQGEMYVRIAPHEERAVQLVAAREGHRHARSARRVPRQLLAGARSCRWSARGRGSSPICACRCATSRRSTSAAAAPISTSRCAVPISRRSPTTAKSSASRRPSWASSTPTSR